MANTDSKYHQDMKVHIFKKCTVEVLSDVLFNTRYFSILLVRKGSVTLLINETKKELTAHKLIVIPVKSFCKVLNMNYEPEVLITLFTSEFAFKNSIRKSHIGYFELFIMRFPQKISLKNKEVSFIVHLFKFLDNNSKDSEHLFQKEKLLFSFNLLVYEIAGIYFKNVQHTGSIKHTQKEKLVLRFLKLLEPNCRKQHQVTFYSNALFVTVGHLNRTVKEVTGKTAKQLIEEAIIIEAKILLQDDTLTISEIIEELEFGDLSFFGKFFKKHTFMSPTEYRLKLKF